MQSTSSRVKSITSVHNGFGKQSLKALEKLFGPPGEENKTKQMEELNLNGARVTSKSLLAELI